MNHFHRIKLGLPDPAGHYQGTVLLSDAGLCYRLNDRKEWNCEGPLVAPGSRLHDVSGHPTHKVGSNGDLAVAPTGDYWNRGESEWEYGGCFVKDRPSDLMVKDLRIDGRFSPPTIEGRIPVYDRKGRYIADIELAPRLRN